MATIIINNTNLKERYNAALREYNCCKSLVGLYPNQYSKPLEKAKKELEKIEREISENSADIISAAVAKVVEKQQKKDEYVELVEVPIKKQEKKEKKESKKDSTPQTQKKATDNKPKEEIKAGKYLTDDEINNAIKEKNKVEEAYLKKHSPKQWKMYMLFSDEQMLNAVKGAIKSIVPLENYSRPQLDALLWYVTKFGENESRTLYVPKLTNILKKELKSSKYEFDDFDLAIKEEDKWVYLSSELNNNEIIRLEVKIPDKKQVKIITENEESQQAPVLLVQMQQPINPEDSINPFLELQTNPGRLIPGYTAR